MNQNTPAPDAREALIAELRETIEGLQAKCALLSVSLRQADRENDALRAALANTKEVAT